MLTHPAAIISAGMLCGWTACGLAIRQPFLPSTLLLFWHAVQRPCGKLCRNTLWHAGKIHDKQAKRRYWKHVGNLEAWKHGGMSSNDTMHDTSDARAEASRRLRLDPRQHGDQPRREEQRPSVQPVQQQPEEQAATPAPEPAAAMPPAPEPVRSRKEPREEPRDPYRKNSEWGDDLVPLQIRVPSQLLKALRHLSVEDDVTVSKVVLRALYGRFFIRKTWISSRQEQQGDDWE
jgi:hypothetical protein